MLKKLRIKNYAIINDLEIDFSNGFNVFTGETGAGKSIIVGALSLLFGARSDSSLIKKGADKAIIEGNFELTQDIKDKLNENDIDYDDELIVRRTISQDKNIIRVNDTSVTLSFLNSLFNKSIDIHSQKDNQYLYDKSNQKVIVDNYIDKDLKDKYSALYEDYETKLNEYNDLINSKFNEQEFEFFNYEYNELSKLNLDEENEFELLEKEKLINSSVKNVDTINNALYLINEDNGINENFSKLIKLFNSNDEVLTNIHEKLMNCFDEFNEITSELETINSTSSFTESEINEIEEQLFNINKIKRKYKKSLFELKEYRESLKTKIDFYNNKEVVLADSKKALDKAKEETLKVAKKISKERKEISTKLSKEIIDELNELMLKNVEFNIDIKEKELSKDGIDDLEFMISLNKGQDLKPLKSVASGGENSRVLLAIKTILTKSSDLKLIVFDEIDTGVSGYVASRIGEKMKDISAYCEIICITHLAPVACYADNHYLIYKKDNKTETNTYIELLDEKSRIEQLAIMSSSSTSKSALDSAKELLDKARNYETR